MHMYIYYLCHKYTTHLHIYIYSNTALSQEYFTSGVLCHLTQGHLQKTMLRSVSAAGPPLSLHASPDFEAGF